MTSKVVKSSLLKKHKPISVSLPTDQYDYSSIERGLMANIIHSLDSSNIHLLVEKWIAIQEYYNLYTIHDCFASTSGEMEKMEKCVREVFALMYFKEEYLIKFHENILSQIRDDTNIYIKDGNYYLKAESEDTRLPARQVTSPRAAKQGRVKINLDKKGDILIELPVLPMYSWDDNHKYMMKNVLDSLYFIS